LTISAPSRPPRPSDPVRRDELDALVRALIEEARRRARRRRRIIAAVVGSAALVGIAVLVAFDRRAHSQSTSPTRAARPGFAAAQTRSKIAFTTFSHLRRGKAVLNRTELYVMNADGSDKRRLAATISKPQTGMGLSWGPVWSPDGSELAIGRSGQLVVMSPAGKVRRILTAHGGVGAPAWSPDGRLIAFSGDNGPVPSLYVMNADGSGQRQVTADGVHAWGPAWSPDGRRIAFGRVVRGVGNKREIGVWVVNLDGSDLTNMAGATGGDAPLWSPDGRTIAFITYRDGTRAKSLYVVNADDGSVQRRPARISQSDGSFSWSPDGRKVAFVNDRDGNDEVYVMNADGSGQRNLTRHPGRDGHPVWSPDGRTIGFVSNRGGNRDIYVMNADGSTQRNLTSDIGHQAFAIAWMPTPRSSSTR
jgi:Tol biopolymer transport system component